MPLGPVPLSLRELQLGGQGYPEASGDGVQLSPGGARDRDAVAFSLLTVSSLWFPRDEHTVKAGSGGLQLRRVEDFGDPALIFEWVAEGCGLDPDHHVARYPGLARGR